MNPKKWGGLALAALLLVGYNSTQPGLIAMRRNKELLPGTKKHERYGPSMEWLDRLMSGESGSDDPRFKQASKLNFNVLSSMMIAGLASGFRSQVANLLWMKSDEYWHKGLVSRQIPLMEAVVTLDPQFVDAWSTAGWHWAYNIYADLPEQTKLKHNPKALHDAQRDCIDHGLDYLKRGANMNPETYRLWFEDGWTRYKKGGILDETAAELFRKARQQKDARDIEGAVKDKEGHERSGEVRGQDLIGRTIGHIYEDRPEIDKALNQYSIMLANGRYEATHPGKTADPDSQTPLDPAAEKLMIANGEYWARYGTDYTQIAALYNDSDAVIKTKIRALIPDIDRLVAACGERDKMGVYDSQPTGAFVSIAARYLTPWKQMKAGDTDGAIATLIGVMNANTRYHLKDIAVTGKVFELRGDAPAVIKKELDAAKDDERSSSQEIGLHFLAGLYEKLALQTVDLSKKKAYTRLAFESWYRARERNSLDYYAAERAYVIGDRNNFAAPQNIINEVKKSRATDSDVNAAPEAPPNVAQYQTAT